VRAYKVNAARSECDLALIAFEIRPLLAHHALGMGDATLICRELIRLEAQDHGTRFRGQLTLLAWLEQQSHTSQCLDGKSIGESGVGLSVDHEEESSLGRRFNRDLTSGREVQAGRLEFPAAGRECHVGDGASTGVIGIQGTRREVQDVHADF
jgi:hypothetical protein